MAIEGKKETRHNLKHATRDQRQSTRRFPLLSASGEQNVFLDKNPGEIRCFHGFSWCFCQILPEKRLILDPLGPMGHYVTRIVPAYSR